SCLREFLNTSLVKTYKYNAFQMSRPQQDELRGKWLEGRPHHFKNTVPLLQKAVGPREKKFRGMRDIGNYNSERT
ncbi:unnamed protein product, partial [Amoebophrya sp. A120]